MDFLMELLGKLQDPASLLPDLNQALTDLVPVIRYAVLLAPAVLLVMGLVYLFLAPKEANHTLGFRCWWGMSSVEVWQFTQKLAGITWTALGLVLGCIGLFTGTTDGRFAPSGTGSTTMGGYPSPATANISVG